MNGVGVVTKKRRVWCDTPMPIMSASRAAFAKPKCSWHRSHGRAGSSSCTCDLRFNIPRAEIGAVPNTSAWLVLHRHRITVSRSCIAQSPPSHTQLFASRSGSDNTSAQSGVKHSPPGTRRPTAHDSAFARHDQQWHRSPSIPTHRVEVPLDPRPMRNRRTPRSSVASNASMGQAACDTRSKM